VLLLQSKQRQASLVTYTFKAVLPNGESFLVHLKRDKMSCTDLLSKFDDLVKGFKEEFDEIVEDERAKMKAEMEAYQAEKQRMKAADVSDDDIILLNGGGQKFTSTRSTLCQVEGS
jgi:hypothetical protein